MSWETIAEAEMCGDVLITDPCYIFHGGNKEWDPEVITEWIRSTGGIVNDTYYGDWGCTLYKTKGRVGRLVEKEQAGHFCADAGMVCVMHLSDVRKIRPLFDTWLRQHYWCGAVVKNFKGNAKFVVRTRKSSYNYNGEIHEYTERELRVRLDGEAEGLKVSFESTQTEA